MEGFTWLARKLASKGKYQPIDDSLVYKVEWGGALLVGVLLKTIFIYSIFNQPSAH